VERVARILAFHVLTIGQGGIVFDSDPYDEWMETINKLGAFSQ
jgi:anthranilate/para-aminobenzoate synthase component I